MAHKEIANAKPFIINKNLGSAMVLESQDFTRTNADGVPVIEPTQKQKYDFDRNGWILIPEVLPDQDVREMRDFCCQLRQDPDSLPEHERCTVAGPLQKLADHPVVVGFMNEFLANPAIMSQDCYGFRMETTHLLFRSVEENVQGKFSPHNGNGLFRLPGDSHFYRCTPGKAWSGLTRVVWELNPVEEGQGGTKFITGSHKAAYPAPETAQDSNSSLWDTYSCPAGSLIVFTESITHSGSPWTNREVDRVPIFNLYNTVASRWHTWVPHPKLLESMPAKRQTLFREPYAGGNVVNGDFSGRTSPYLEDNLSASGNNEI
ncbi:TPA: hypothetical protein EYO57_08105 [Candidatus Poribacteria bacterium]|nr:hypothetical protein [Candidatus Poribacteria bacterium]HIC03800.1 hypothetical protein [Candidatus Poribacteria bacterium]HIC19693.1 hypothetical protein [Candidatus Poribacteria bacterium]HIO48619.1 hypothetical protein [Candidatus Poribacteria bacterium]